MKDKNERIISTKATEILAKINSTTKLGDLRVIAKENKINHELAMDLWLSGQYLPRLLSTLIMDKKQLDEKCLDKLIKDMECHTEAQQIQIMDWLMANQLTKSKPLTALMETWQNSPLPLKRRTFWYYQGRLRWTGKLADNTPHLVDELEKNLLKEDPMVQWAMNFTAGWIGIYNPQYRARCVQLGIDSGLYKDEVVSKGCTPNYLPDFIAIETKKRKLD